MVLHYQQSKPGLCLPACARMVIAALGDTRSEAQLAAAMGSYEFGAPARRVKRLNKLGYQVTYGALPFKELRATLARDLYPIVFVRADMLPWADFGGFHAVVLTEIVGNSMPYAIVTYGGYDSSNRQIL